MFQSTMSSTTYHVAWKTEYATGNGDAVTYELAKEWIDYLNKKFPSMQHWIMTKTVDTDSYDASSELTSQNCPTEQTD
jgi:hypothetical protein